MRNPLRIATRKSPLALWQAEEVKRRLAQSHPDLTLELIPMTTKGDQLLDTPLAKVGGKGLFLKELENAIKNDQADIAVHSVKDIPARMASGFTLGAVMERENPFDAFVSNRYTRFSQLPQNAVLGTCSLRRKAQLLALRPDLRIMDLRGNIGTRLSKLDTEQFDGIILAAAGLMRLGLQDRISESLNPEHCLPAVGQGAIGIQCRNNDEATLSVISALNHDATSHRILAERALNARLDGGCQAPIAAYCEILDDQLVLKARIASPDGQRILESTQTGTYSDAEAIGLAAGEDLLHQGGNEILSALKIA